MFFTAPADAKETASDKATASGMQIEAKPVEQSHNPAAKESNAKKAAEKKEAEAKARPAEERANDEANACATQITAQTAEQHFAVDGSTNAIKQHFGVSMGDESAAAATEEERRAEAAVKAFERAAGKETRRSQQRSAQRWRGS